MKKLPTTEELITKLYDKSMIYNDELYSYAASKIKQLQRDNEILKKSNDDFIKGVMVSSFIFALCLYWIV